MARTKIRRYTFIAFLLTGVLRFAIGGTAGTAHIDPQQYLQHIKYLASPDFKGRATGSEELEKAAQYIAGQFRSFGLQPVSGDGYLQAYPVTTNARLGHGN